MNHVIAEDRGLPAPGDCTRWHRRTRDIALAIHMAGPVQKLCTERYRT